MFNIKTDTRNYASLIVTHACKNNCPYCIDKYKGRQEFISVKNVLNAIKEFKKRNIKDVLIVGGDPLLHPNIKEICQYLIIENFKVILTAHYDPFIIHQLDGIVDCFNISVINGKDEIPHKKNFKSDLTISALIHKKHLYTKKQLDLFIDKYNHHGHLKFSTLSIANKWCKQNQDVQYLDDLDVDKFILFNEIEGIKYRNCIIKRYDKILNKNAYQSLKFHVNGELSNSWERNI